MENSCANRQTEQLGEETSPIQREVQFTALVTFVCRTEAGWRGADSSGGRCDRRTLASCEPRNDVTLLRVSPRDVVNDHHTYCCPQRLSSEVHEVS